MERRERELSEQCRRLTNDLNAHKVLTGGNARWHGEGGPPVILEQGVHAPLPAV